MRLVLVRHGEPDYSGVAERGFFGHGRDLGPLTPAGISEAEAVAFDERLKGADFIVASPYTRALQTAAIISRLTGLEIKPEIDLHEWLSDTTFCRNKDDEYSALSASKECAAFKGKRGAGAVYEWEDLESVADRAYKCLYKYLKYDKIIAVCHGIVMRQFVFAEDVPYCGILETDFDENFKWGGWQGRLGRSSEATWNLSDTIS